MAEEKSASNPMKDLRIEKLVISEFARLGFSFRLARQGSALSDFRCPC